MEGDDNPLSSGIRKPASKIVQVQRAPERLTADEMHTQV